MKYKELIKKIKELKWIVTKSDNYYELSNASPAGQDFSIALEIKEDGEGGVHTSDIH